MRFEKDRRILLPFSGVFRTGVVIGIDHDTFGETKMRRKAKKLIAMAALPVALAAALPAQARAACGGR